MKATITLVDDPNEATNFQTEERAVAAMVMIYNLANTGALRSVGIENEDDFTAVETQDLDLEADGVDCWHLNVSLHRELDGAFGPSRWLRIETESADA